MPLAARHADAIRRLPPKQFQEWARLIARTFGTKPPHTRDALVTMCTKAGGYHPKDLASPLLTRVDELSVGVLEALMGHRIMRAPTPQEKRDAMRRKRPRPPPNTGAGKRRGMIVRLLVPVSENPHHPDSAVFNRYMHYRDGATVDECVLRGLRIEDVLFHEKKGCIRLQDAEEYQAELHALRNPPRPRAA